MKWRYFRRPSRVDPMASGRRRWQSSEAQRRTTCPGLIFIAGLVANDWARFAWEENAEELSLKRAGKSAFSHPGTGGFGLGGWGNLLPTLVGALIRLFRGVSSVI